MGEDEEQAAAMALSNLLTSAMMRAHEVEKRAETNMATGSLASIEPDKRGFWHVNFWEEHPREEGVPCDAFKTTKAGAPLSDAITLAQSFNPKRIAVWQPCEYCSGTGEDAEGETCDECDDGMMCRDLKDLQNCD